MDKTGVSSKLVSDLLVPSTRFTSPFHSSSLLNPSHSSVAMSLPEGATHVWTTLLTNTKYLPGLLALEYSLRKSGTKYPFLVLYTSTLEPEGHAALEARGIPKREIAYLLPKVHKDYGNDVRFYDCWSKLQPFNLTEFKRVVQLDSDMIVVKNMDELMEMELNDTNRIFAASHACTCNPLQKAHYPKDW